MSTNSLFDYYTDINRFVNNKDCDDSTKKISAVSSLQIDLDSKLRNISTTARNASLGVWPNSKCLQENTFTMPVQKRTYKEC